MERERAEGEVEDTKSTFGQLNIRAASFGFTSGPLTACRHPGVESVSPSASSSPLNSLWQNSSPQAVTAEGPEVRFPESWPNIPPCFVSHNGHKSFSNSTALSRREEEEKWWLVF